MYRNLLARIIRTLSLFFVVWGLFGSLDSELMSFKLIFLKPSMIDNSVTVLIIRTALIVSSLSLLIRPTLISLLAVQLIAGALVLNLGIVSAAVWNYNTHVLIIAVLVFLTALRLRLNPNNSAAERDLVTALSLVFATIYFQAAISKIVVSGFEWMNTGLSIYVHLLKFSPVLSETLDGNLKLFQLAGWLTVVGELALGVLFIWPETRKTAAVLSISFHVMLWMTFHISFWHLWIFFPAVYMSGRR